MGAIIDCAATRWQPGIGDPTWQGWATVLLYLVVAALALRTAGQGLFPATSYRRERVFWLAVSGIMLALAVNKQLDLQSALTAVGRCAARAQGWYQDRRLVQTGFLAAIAVAAILLLLALLRLLRGTLPRTGLAVVGLVFVSGFVLMRAVGFHHFDRMLGIPVVGVRANFVLESVGPILIAVGAILAVRLPARPTRR